MPGCRGRHTSEQTRWASGNTCIIKGKATVCKVQQSQVSFCSMLIIWGFKKTTNMSLNLLFRSWLTPTARWEACLSKLFGELGKITAGSDLGKNWACTSTSHAGTHRSHRSWSLQFQHSRSWKHSYSVAWAKKKYWNFFGQRRAVSGWLGEPKKQVSNL